MSMVGQAPTLLAEAHAARDKAFDQDAADVVRATPLPFQEPRLRSSKVAICGFGTESLHEAPFDDPDCEIWILNMLHGAVPRWDRLFELHDRATVEQESDTAEELRKVARGGQAHLDYLCGVTDRPIYMVEPWADVPCSIRFPLERLVRWQAEACGKLAAQPYFTSTFAYMMLYAALRIVDRRQDPRKPEDGEEIHVCGVEMVNGEEYAYQRSNAEFMCGVVAGLGIQLFVPQRRALLASDGMYGYAKSNDTLELLARLRSWAVDQKKHFEGKRAEAGKAKLQAEADWQTYDGAMQMADKTVGQLVYLIRGGKI